MSMDMLTDDGVRAIIDQHETEKMWKQQDEDAAIIGSPDGELIEHEVSWDEWFMGLAEYVATRSKDPSTKVGAVVVKDRRVVGMGYNGLPAGIADTVERYSNERKLELKYPLVIHAEDNALRQAGRDARGATLYVTPLFSCSDCAKTVIQSEIVRIVTPRPNEERWMSSYDRSQALYREAGVEMTFI